MGLTACDHVFRVVDDSVDGGVLPGDASVIPADGVLVDLPQQLRDLPLPDGPSPDTLAPATPCKEISYTNPKGHKKVTLRQDLVGDWTAALDPSAFYTPVGIQNRGAKMAAAALDYTYSNQEVAGFVISRDTTKANVQAEMSAIIAALINSPPGGSGTVAVRASGTQVPSHDLFTSVQGTILDVKLTAATSVSMVRNFVVAKLLGRQPTQLLNLPGSYGAQDTGFVLRFVSVKRYQLKVNPATGKPLTDKNGYGLDTGNKQHWRLVVMGAVSRAAAYKDPKFVTRFVVDDLSNGTALARAGRVVVDGCESHVVKNVPTADIIWVVDESGSMSDNRNDIVDNANDFFGRAKASGLDFRMGVTNVCTPHGSYGYAVGKFCSDMDTSKQAKGGDDRFLKPDEQLIFTNCIRNPPGYEGGSEYGMVNARAAVERHLPRAGNDPFKIRPGANLVIIVATDEVPNSLTATIGYSNYKRCTLSSATQTSLDAAIKQHLDFFAGKINPEAKAQFHVIGGTCNNSCGAQVAHGYKDLAQKLGGQVGDVCQQNLGPTLQVIINSIVGSVSPVKLVYTPISSTLSVTINGALLKRSTTKGFDYAAAAKTMTFVNTKFTKGMTVVVGYKRFG